MTATVTTAVSGYKTATVTSTSSDGYVLTLSETSDASDVGRILYAISGAQVGESRNIVSVSGNEYTIDSPFSVHPFRAYNRGNGTPPTAANLQSGDTLAFSIRGSQLAAAVGNELTLNGNRFTQTDTSLSSNLIYLENGVVVNFRNSIININWRWLRLRSGAAVIFGRLFGNPDDPMGDPISSHGCRLEIEDDNYWWDGFTNNGNYQIHGSSIHGPKGVLTTAQSRIFWRWYRGATAKHILFQNLIQGYFGLRVSGENSVLLQNRTTGGFSSADRSTLGIDAISGSTFFGINEGNYYGNTQQAIYHFLTVSGSGVVKNTPADYITGSYIFLNQWSGGTLGSDLYRDYEDNDLDRIRRGIEAGGGVLAKAYGTQTGSANSAGRAYLRFRNNLSLSVIDGATDEAITENAKLTVMGSDGSSVEATTTTGTFTKQLLLKRLIELARTASNDTTTRDYTFESGTGVDRYTYLIQVDGRVPIYKNSDLLKPYTAVESMVDDTERTELDSSIVDAYTTTENTNKAYDYSTRKRFLTPSDSFSMPYLSKSGNNITSRYSIALDEDDSAVQSLASNVFTMTVGTVFTGDITTTTTAATPTVSSMGANINLGGLRIVGVARSNFITNPNLLTTIPTNRTASSTLDDWDGELQVNIASGQTRYIIVRNLTGSKTRRVRVTGGGTLQILGLTQGGIQSSAGIQAVAGTVTYEPLPAIQPKLWDIVGVPATVNIAIYNATGNVHTPDNGTQSGTTYTFSRKLLDTGVQTVARSTDGTIKLRGDIPSGNTDSYDGFHIPGLGTTITKCTIIATSPLHEDTLYDEIINTQDFRTDQPRTPTVTNVDVSSKANDVTYNTDADLVEDSVEISLHTVNDNVGVPRLKIDGHSTAQDSTTGIQEGSPATFEQTSEMFTRVRGHYLWRQAIYNAIVRATASGLLVGRPATRGKYIFEMLKFSNKTYVSVEQGFVQLDGGDSIEVVSGLLMVRNGEFLTPTATDLMLGIDTGEEKSLEDVGRPDSRGNGYGNCTGIVIGTTRQGTAKSRARIVSVNTIADSRTKSLEEISELLSEQTTELSQSSAAGLGLRLSSDNCVSLSSFDLSKWSALSSGTLGTDTSRIQLTHAAITNTATIGLQYTGMGDFTTSTN